MKNNDYLNNIIDYIENNDDLLNYLSSECGFDVEEYDQLLDDLGFLMESTKSNYNIEPFACDGSGGIYALLDNELVGYIDSEGQAGIVAKNIHDFFGILIHCGCLEDFGKFGWLDSQSEFMEQYKKCEESYIKEFSEEFELENEPQKIYHMFKDAVLTQPKLTITATSEDYEDYQQMFEIEQEQ